jgi:hypothetical protein
VEGLPQYQCYPSGAAPPVGPDSDIVARGECAGIMKAWATGILVSLRRNCKDYLTSTDGRYCEGKQTDEMVASARGMLA